MNENHEWKEFTYKKLRWKYSQYGNGTKPLLIFPGGLRKPLEFKEFENPLIDDFIIFTLRYPLTGSVKLLAEGAHQILIREGLRQVYLLGSSFGGVMVQAYSTLFPSTVRKAIISNTGTRSDDIKMIKRLRLSLILIKIFPKLMVNKIIYKGFSKLFVGLGEMESRFKKLLKEMIDSKEYGKPEMIAHFQGLIEFHVSSEFAPDRLRPLQDKLLIIASSNDKGTLDDAIPNLNKVYPKARFQNFENAGHFAMILQPKAYFGTIKQFFQ